MITTNISRGKPFIKWVGGKTRLLSQLEENLPKRLYKEPFIYIEPFVGGGAMLFYMLQKFPNIKKTIINDINEDLITAYRTIKNSPADLIEALKGIEDEYKAIKEENERRKFYLKVREKYNEHKMSDVEKTQCLMFLNRTCFNGLYRVNSKGKFNVSFGRYEDPMICNAETILFDSNLLNEMDVIIEKGQYFLMEKYIDNSELNFLYLDPPYRPINSTSNFNSYDKEQFSDKQQIELSKYCSKISSRNCLWMQSNSDGKAKNPDNTFLEDLYQDFKIQRVYAARSVNSNINRRGKLTELLITNY
jgi:DNA adenine methylase